MNEHPQGVVLLDVEASTFDFMCDLVAHAMGEQFQFDEIRTSAVMHSLKRKYMCVVFFENCQFFQNCEMISSRVPTRLSTHTFPITRKPTQATAKPGSLEHATVSPMRRKMSIPASLMNNVLTRCARFVVLFN